MSVLLRQCIGEDAILWSLKTCCLELVDSHQSGFRFRVLVGFKNWIIYSDPVDGCRAVQYMQIVAFPDRQFGKVKRWLRVLCIRTLLFSCRLCQLCKSLFHIGIDFPRLLLFDPVLTECSLFRRTMKMRTWLKPSVVLCFWYDWTDAVFNLS